MGNKYFGTDGIRATVGASPMTPEFALKLGWAAGTVFAAIDGQSADARSARGRPRVLIGKDTRLSGYMLESALESGFAAAGVDVLLVGPLPTPGIAYLARTFRAAAAVVISASHNPFEDNGFKFFSRDGQKLPDAMEKRIETQLDQPLSCVAAAGLGRATRVESASGRYIEFCKSTARFGPGGLAGLRVVLDCANGATYHVAPDVFRELNADVTTIGVEPNGMNINDGCGSTAPDDLARTVVAEGADLGIAFDGDGDRCIMVDAAGEIVDGDQLLYVIARSRQACGELNAPVVGTLMSNLGLALAFERAGIGFERAAVGDRYVFERLQALGGTIGGESSGHVLCLDRATTGDGIVTALQVLAPMIDSQQSLAALIADVEHCPQVLTNVQLAPGEATHIMDAECVRDAVVRAEAELGDDGRVLLRPSGTEPKLRVMVEGLDRVQVESLASTLAESVQSASTQNA